MYYTEEEREKRFSRSSASVYYTEEEREKRFSRSSASVYYTEEEREKRFSRSSASVYYTEEEREKRFSRSSASVYYTERKPKNENGGGLGTRLHCCYDHQMKPLCVFLCAVVSLQPYCDQIDQVEASVSALEQTAYSLDAYCKRLGECSLLYPVLDRFPLVLCPDPTQLTRGEGVWCHKSECLG